MVFTVPAPMAVILFASVADVQPSTPKPTGASPRCVKCSAIIAGVIPIQCDWIAGGARFWLLVLHDRWSWYCGWIMCWIVGRWHGHGVGVVVVPTVIVFV